VYLVREKTTHRIYALKTLFKSQYRRLDQYWADEVRLQWALRDCPYVLRLEDWFEDATRVYLVLEYAAQGDLFENLPLSPSKAIQVVRQITLALQECHRRGIAHRDLKPENVLLTAEGDVRLADFGWASDEVVFENACGTPDYLSPQHVLSASSYTLLTDLWSLGVLIYELLTGQSPFFAEGLAETYRKIAVAQVTFPVDFPPLAREVVERLLRVEEQQRLPLAAILQHSFLNVSTTA
jgi:serine/threonine protein kinase